MSDFTILIKHSSRSLSHKIRYEEKIKGIQIGKEAVKLSLSADDMILYTETLKAPPKNYLI